MKTRSESGDDLAGGGSGNLPPVDFDLAVDEGPMRRELLRQIRQLEDDIARFITDNCPYEPPIVASPNRGPAIQTNADLERIRDELLESRAALHERIVDRVASMSGERTRRTFPAWMQRFRK
ncbi:MAG: hypothetical protein QOF76_122 [Solirubrobacteraceae bacterium]|nr:hypothetical protein [Solirubrobacteraceae bacterium]